MPTLLYGLETCPLRSSDNNSLDFVINHFFMKLFKTNNIETVTYCRTQFNFDLPSTILRKRSDVFAVMFLLYNLCILHKHRRPVRADLHVKVDKPDERVLVHGLNIGKV